MTIPELIARLQAIQRAHGALPVYHFEDVEEERPLNHLIVEQPERYGPETAYPARVVLHSSASSSRVAEGAVLVRPELSLCALMGA